MGLFIFYDAKIQQNICVHNRKVTVFLYTMFMVENNKGYKLLRNNRKSVLRIP